MITAALKTILTTSGCTLVLYEQAQLANLYTDQSDQNDIIGLVTQLDSLVLEVRANAIMEHYPALVIEVSQQVKMEDAAWNNEVKLQALLDICKEVIVRIISLGTFKTILPVSCNKIYESKYDANVIGWTMTMDITYLRNENRSPCVAVVYLIDEAGNFITDELGNLIIV
ncbi:MAG TPA: hypothetical protein VMV77_08795 [Bacteroidales bacterium]|nr:hypothetical protein [Bacteroidales bacterium]